MAVVNVAIRFLGFPVGFFQPSAQRNNRPAMQQSAIKKLPRLKRYYVSKFAS
tara:strand:- start:81944 stop:82099 length:156 start_codon:yes stop_codon:yes gene_type:complete